LKLYCDASANGLGVCLSHVMANKSEHPVAYASRILMAPEKNYMQIECEALAIIFAVHRFHQYLYGRTFTLVTDHCPLCKIFGDKEGILPLAATRMQCWVLLLSAYRYNIEYISGKSHYSADNGPPFTSSQFATFMKANDILHKRVPLYHPFSNGLAKNFVKTVKQALNKADKSLSLESNCQILSLLP